MEENVQVGWNLAQSLLQEIASLLEGASRAYIAGNYPNAFNHLRAVRMRISPSLKKEEHKEMTEKESGFAKWYGQSISTGFSQTKMQSFSAFKVFQIYGQYNDLLMQALGKYGYLIPPKEDKTNLNK